MAISTTQHSSKVSHVPPPAPKSALSVLAESFKRSLLAENKSPRTVETYGEALRRFDDFLARKGMPRNPIHIMREHVEAFIAELLAISPSWLARAAARARARSGAKPRRRWTATCERARSTATPICPTSGSA